MFAERIRAVPHVTGNYSETKQNQIADLSVAGSFICVGLVTLCYMATNQVTKSCVLSLHYSSLFLQTQKVQSKHLANNFV